MVRETKTIRAIKDAAGVISYGEGTEIPVRFDLLETQDFVNGVPGPRFSLGDIRYGAESEQTVSMLVRNHTRLILRGAGIQAVILLHRNHRFTVMGSIKPSTHL